MKKIPALVFLISFLLPISAFAEFDVIFDNIMNEKLVYNLERVDHPYGFPEPMIMAGGELQAFSKNKLEVKYSSGKYRVRWTSRKGENINFSFFVGKEVNVLTITPESILFDGKFQIKNW